MGGTCDLLACDRTLMPQQWCHENVLKIEIKAEPPKQLNSSSKFALRDSGEGACPHEIQHVIYFRILILAAQASEEV
jgi:hypothetical protein